MEQEASRFADQTPNRLQAAEGLFREGLLAIRLGDGAAARRALVRGRQALDQLPDDDVRRRYQWLLDKARAEDYLHSGRVQASLDALGHFNLAKTEQPHERVEYYRLRALASAASGDRTGQLRFLTLATEETEHALVGLTREDDRIRWRRQSGAIFRPLVELTLAQRGGAMEGLQLWERYLDRTVQSRHEWTQSSSLPIAALQSATLLSFLWLPDRVGYWIADDRGADFVWVAEPSSEVAALCHRFARQCSDEGVPEGEVRRTARALYHQLFGPAAGADAFRRLADHRKLVVEADGELGGIPFEALVDAAGRYLAEAHPVVYSSGLRRWEGLREIPGPVASSEALIVAGPAVSGGLARQFPPLADARREGEVVASAFPHATVLAGRNGTLPAVLAHLGTAEVFHFSGHGLSNSEDGALLLAPAGADEEGSLLTTAEFADRTFPHCRLAVLSACSSGVGESRGPVNPQSLVNGLSRAGVRDIVASRWPIDSASTLLLMRHFYGCLISTGDVASALQHAAGEIRHASGLSHPYYWASFSTFGE
jgi:CHAT domain-containing protein